jgi:hypothetical protein
VTRLLLIFIVLHAAAQTPTPGSPPQPPGSTSPSAPKPPGTVDPATATFTTDIGVLLVAVKPDKVADYEAAIVALQEALAKAEDPEIKTLAKGWRVFKATELDAKANALYIHWLQPTVPDVDYRPSLLLDKLLSGAPADLVAKYRDAFAGAPTKLALVEFANMAVAPVAKPTNASPDAPTAPAKPRNGSPLGPTVR